MGALQDPHRRGILLTGGAGYIGSHTAKLLSQLGFSPVVVDNLSTGNRWAVKWGPLIVGDIRDSSLVQNIIREYAISGVIHFAASAYVGDSMRLPREYFRNNIVGSLEFLEAVIDAGVRAIVFSSTCATYGEPTMELISEKHLQRPVNPYGESKLTIERVLGWYDRAYGLKSVCLRYFNAAGADVDREIGESHDPETHLIPLAIQTALGFREQLEIYGTDYPTPDGTAVRDYVHVSDLGHAHVLALRYLLERNSSLTVNLGTGRGSSIQEVVRSVEDASGCPVKVRLLERRAGDPARLVADPKLASRVLGWRAAKADLNTMVRTALAWHSAEIPILSRAAGASSDN